MKYKVGEELNVCIKVLQVDDTGMPYYVGFILDDGDDTGVWLDSETLEKAVAKANPDQYRQSILEQIQVLQKELDEIDGTNNEQLVVGKTYRVVGNNSFHEFRTGELVKVVCFDEDEEMYKAYDLGCSNWWFIDINDVEGV